jgi:hypothetical protein
VLDAHLARSRSRIMSAGLFDIGHAGRMEAALAAMRNQLDTVAPTPFLHDTTTKNVIVTPEGVLAGIVDVDDLCFGDPRYPAALTLAALIAVGGSAGYVSAWMRHAGHADDHVFRLYVGLFLLDLMSEHGQSFNGNVRPSTPDGRAALNRAFAGNLHLIKPI